MHRYPSFQALLAEFFGTFCLVFAGTGAIVINHSSGGAVTHVGVALTFGLVVMAMIYTVGDISGAHLNPAVTIGFWAAGRLPFSRVLPYAGVQVAAAISASAILRLLYPADELLGATQPAGAPWQAFVLEVILTLILMLVILSVSMGAKERGITAGIVIGGVIGLEAMFAGPATGASMNPARSIGPALVSGTLDHLWVYLTAPILGAVLAFPLCRAMRDRDCCAGCCSREQQTQS